MFTTRRLLSDNFGLTGKFLSLICFPIEILFKQNQSWKGTYLKFQTYRAIIPFIFAALTDQYINNSLN